MGDQADAGGEEARVLGRSRHVAGVIGREGAVHRRDVHPDLLEQPPVHHPHDPAAALGPLPGGANEASRLSRKQVRRGLVLQRLEGVVDAVPQALEPVAGFGFQVGERISVGHPRLVCGPAGRVKCAPRR